MRLLDRYTLREFLFWLAVFFGAFLFIWIAFDLSFELHRYQQYHLRAKDIVEYYVFEIPEFFPMALPISLLLALLYSVTNHARYNEITAMRAAGISLARICLPYVCVGILLSIGSLLFNEYCAPGAADKADQVLRRRVEKITATDRYKVQPFTFINFSVGGLGRVWTAPVYNMKTTEMLKPTVAWPTNGASRFWLSADSAVWTNHAWVFSGDVVENLDNVRVMKTTNALAVPEFKETPKEIQSVIRVNAYRGLNSRTHRADVPLRDVINYLRLNPHPDRKMRNWLYTKLHGRFAGPFACLVVVFVAIPFAAGSGRRNVFVGVAASISIFFVYFVLQQVGLTFGETGWLPPWLGAWFPNLFFGLGGLLMMLKVR
ncbi:MAG TPA: LptF/LptG family permease [Candidatus Polarisedimenticolia bacterium]|nr:LptF/LptG family permease [Candidatus Polarisedimenticolia bacterium]